MSTVKLEFGEISKIGKHAEQAGKKLEWNHTA